LWTADAAGEARTDAGGQWLYLPEDNGAVLTGWAEPPEGETVIPAFLDGYPVTAIGESAFDDCTGLTAVILPQGVRSMGDWSFAGCSGLTAAELPDGLLFIGNGAFSMCEGLSTIILPDSVTSLGFGAFYGCVSLTALTLPASIVYIGENAFQDCDRLLLTVTEGSAAERYAKENGIAYTYQEAESVFARLNGCTFVFASGVGGWATEMGVSADGRFRGYFYDSDMGDTGEDYPDGTLYECFFSGRFSVVGPLGEYTYVLRLDELVRMEEEEAVSITNGVRRIIAGAYGLEGGDVFVLYCPGIQTDGLPDAFIEWICLPNAWAEPPETMPFYGLYNVEAGTGFFAYPEK
jgi:hypothetical protein